MAFHTFGPGLALDRVTMAPLPAVVASLEDAETGEPVQAFSMDDESLPVLVATNRYGYFGQFKVPEEVRRLRLTFAGLTLEHTAWELIPAALEQAIAARDEAEQAKIAAQQAAALVAAPADTVVKTLIQGAATQTSAALKAKFGDPLTGYKAKLGTDAPNTYPAGPSVGLFSNADGWPHGAGFSLVVTNKGPGFDAAVSQVAYHYQTPATIPLFRVATSSTEWGPWAPMGAGTPPLATSTTDGLMPKADKAKLDGLGGLATSAADGLMPKADKAKLDGGTSAANASRLVLRDSAGRAKFANPSASTDAANKGYVDGIAAQAAKDDLTTRQLSYRLTHHVSTSPAFIYHVARVRTYGQFVPGIVEKHLAGNYEKTYTSGAFSPTAAPLRTHEFETGGTLVVNSSAWADAGPMTGVVIKDGIAYTDFATSPKGRHALGVMKNGEFRIFQQGTDTAASMVAAGVTDTFVYGPPLVRNGVKENMTSILAEWPDGNDRRPRTLLGQTATGDVLVVLIEGDRSPRLGANFTDCANLAVELGMHNAIIMDGGGSTQGIAGGAFFAHSSDATPRAVKETLVMHIPQGNANDDSPQIWYESTVTAGTGTLKYRRTNSGGEARLILRGNITGVTAINTTIFTLPKEFWPTDWIYETVGCVVGGTIILAGIVIKSNGDVQITRKDGTAWAGTDRYDFNVEVALN